MREHGTYGVRAGSGMGSQLTFPAGARLTHLFVQPADAGGTVAIETPRGNTHSINCPAASGAFDLYPNGDLPVSTLDFTTMKQIVAEFVY